MLLWHRLLHHHWLLLKDVDILRVIEVINQVIQLHLWQALALQEVLALVQIEAHIGSLLHEGFLLLNEVGGNGADLRPDWPHRELLLDLASLLLRSRMWVDALLAHPVEQLSWHLHERLLRQQVRIVLEVVEGDKLHDVRSHVLAIRLRVECLIISIKRFHRLEVSIADTDNNDGEGQLGATDDLIDRLVHIADHTVRDDNQDVELLVHLIDRLT